MIGRSACVFRSACQTGVHDHQCTIKPPSTTWFSANVVEGLPFGVLWMECGRISTYKRVAHQIGRKRLHQITRPHAGRRQITAAIAAIVSVLSVIVARVYGQ
ncbi:hypothetical protein [uncultured Bifidobacterium sp.]|uniref:hypothetical protein n=1 Tax=uncultured Bifidobacterium sp. TaxID=165187 RepID=UPI002589AD8C|nr:hypothetical protein [uncultured Bifidobacterium sp.]